jgi:S-DNA-T family DNA segregation ATPase FtsK/SpoIIIE
MFFAKKKTKRKNKFFSISASARQSVWGLMLILLAIVLAASFLGKAGMIGQGVNTIFAQLLGNGKWILPVLLSLSAASLGGSENNNFDSANIFGLFLFLICASALLYFFSFDSRGGLLGSLVAEWSINYFGPLISAVLLSVGLIVSLLLLFDTSLSNLFGQESVVFKIIAIILGLVLYPFIKRDGDDENAFSRRHNKKKDEEEDEDGDEEGGKEEVEVKEYDIEEDEEEEKKDNPNTVLSFEDRESIGGVSGGLWPKSNIRINVPIELLKNKPKKPISGNTVKNQEIIRETLKDFGISVEMSDVTIGPTVTQYSFKPRRGISVNRIKALSEDLALNLAVHPVRIEAPIPGKSLVGLEIPNQTKVLVSLKEIIKSKIFKLRQSNTIIPLGRDVTGKIITDDLVKLPHILVAGATNSGKSVFLHSLISSLIFQNNPDDLRFILIDQKQVELSLYNDMPYLVAPVVTEHKRAIRALQWSVNEMDRRLEKINEAKCQNIADYNKKKTRESMPYLVIVVDELGDLLSTARKEAESAIIRLGSKARAAGIHLVLATQRPSVDILSGLIKANMPARTAFSVTSSVNSKTILDFIGAEKLMGQGDMLYINSAMSKPVRVQGAFVSKEEIKRIVKYIKKKAGKASYSEDFEKKGQVAFDYGEEDEGDEMMEEAKELILNIGKASATMLQSRLGIGYPRANRILDNLEKQGIVGPSIQNKPRQVYIDKFD